MEMGLRLLVIGLFSISAIILGFAYLRRPFTYHLLGIIVWCLHVILFTFCATMRAVGACPVDPHLINMWSNVVRIHGGIVMFTTALYYVDRKELKR